MTDQTVALRIYHEIAALIERRLPELSEDSEDRAALEACLVGLRERAPRGPRRVALLR